MATARLKRPSLNLFKATPPFPPSQRRCSDTVVPVASIATTPAYARGTTKPAATTTVKQPNKPRTHVTDRRSDPHRSIASASASAAAASARHEEAETEAVAPIVIAPVATTRRRRSSASRSRRASEQDDSVEKLSPEPEILHPKRRRSSRRSSGPVRTSHDNDDDIVMDSVSAAAASVATAASAAAAAASALALPHSMIAAAASVIAHAPSITDFQLSAEQQAFVDSPYVHIEGSRLRVQAGPGSGKCWSRGTQLMMFDGSLKKVEDIKAGDELMGDDCTPRKVLVETVQTFRNKSFQVTSVNRGRDTWYCNDDHVLVLKWNMQPSPEKVRQGYYVLKEWIVENARPTTRVAQVNGETLKFQTREEADDYLSTTYGRNYQNGQIFESTVRNFMTLSAKVRSKCQMYQPNIVNFGSSTTMKEKLIELWGDHVTDHLVIQTAWVLGMWLADGYASCAKVAQIGDDRNNHAHSHQPVIDELVRWYKSMYLVEDDIANATVSKHRLSSAGNVVYDINLGPMFYRFLLGLDLIKNKHFPLNILTQSADIRRALFAGMIDGDGHHCLEYKTNISTKCWEVSAKERKFMDGFVYLSRSLGFSTGHVATTKCTNKDTGEVYSGFRVQISGDEVSSVQTVLTYKRIPSHADMNRWPNKDQRCDSFTVQATDEVADFHGFQLDGNGRCLMADFVVTHNSTTIMHFAKQHPDLKILYLVLNASMAEKAKTAMAALPNIDVFTFHALAYDQKVRQEGFKLCEDEDQWRGAANGMMFRHQGRGLSRKELFHVLKGLQLFWQSDDLELTSWHYSHLWPSARSQRSAASVCYLPSAEQCLQWGNQFMRWMRAKELPLTFGMMLKQLHLDIPDLASKYKVCILDEAQDAFAVVDDTLHPKPRLARDGTLTKAGRPWVIIWVGDRYQQINQFLGGVNAMERRDFTASYYFPHSRRFGTEIALFRNELFRMVDLTDEPVVGDATIQSQVRPFCFYGHKRNRLAKRGRDASGDDVSSSSAAAAAAGATDDDGDDDDNNSEAADGGLGNNSTKRRWLWEERTCRWAEPNDMYRDAFGPRARIIRDTVVGVLAHTNMTLLRILTTTYRPWIAAGSIRYVMAKSLQAYAQHILALLRMTDEELQLEEKQALEERQLDVLGKVDYVRRVGVAHIPVLEHLIAHQTASMYDQGGDVDEDDDAEQETRPIMFFTSTHSAKGSDFNAVIICRDLEEAMLEALFIPRPQFEALQTDEQVDTFMRRHAASKSRHEYDLPTTFLGGVGITRVEETLCVPEQLYKLYRYFKRKSQLPPARAAHAAHVAKCKPSTVSA